MPSPPLHIVPPDPDEDDLDFDSPTASTALLHVQRLAASRDATLSPRLRHPHFIRVVAVCILTAFVVEIGDFMERAPMTRVMEDILCRKHYESTAPLGTHFMHPIPEQDCKIPAVQGPLTMLKGWDMALSSIPGLLLAVPFGYVADTYGRKIVVVTSLLGVTLGLIWSMIVLRFDNVFDVRWLWAGNLFLTLGGGSAVVRATLFAIFSDVTPENKRAAVFFQFTSASTLSTLIGVPASWYLMKTSSFLAMGVGLIFIASALALLIFFLPETLDQAKLSEASFHAAAGDVTPEEEGLLQPSKPVSILDIINGSNFLFANPALCTLVVTFVMNPVIGYSGTLLIQIASERYHWSIADSSFLSPFSSVVLFLVLVVILPGLYSILGSRLHLRPAIKDLVVARGSLIFLVLGALVIAMAPTPPFLLTGIVAMDLGTGYMSAVRSLATSFVHADQVSRLYAVCAMVETFGALVASPIISESLGWGLELGGIWSGMVYIVTAAMVLVLGIPVWIIHAPKPEEDVHG